MLRATEHTYHVVDGPAWIGRFQRRETCVDGCREIPGRFPVPRLAG